MVASGVVVAVIASGKSPGKGMEYPLRGGPAPRTAAHLLRDRNGGGCGSAQNAHGLMHSYEGKSSPFTHSDGLSTDQVFTLFEDREGTIWVATPDGLDQFRESPVGSLTAKDGLSNATALHPSWRRATAAYGSARRMGSTGGRTDKWRFIGGEAIPGLPDDQIDSFRG